jgi:hypothetical protein
VPSSKVTETDFPYIDRYSTNYQARVNALTKRPPGREDKFDLLKNRGKIQLNMKWGGEGIEVRGG